MAVAGKLIASCWYAALKNSAERAEFTLQELRQKTMPERYVDQRLRRVGVLEWPVLLFTDDFERALEDLEALNHAFQRSPVTAGNAR